MAVKPLRISLRPYPGVILYCRTPKQIKREYEKRTKQKYPYTDEKLGGRFVKLEYDLECEAEWLIYGVRPAVVAHEVAHVLLHLSKRIGYDPLIEQEPFCYMLSQILLEIENG